MREYKDADKIVFTSHSQDTNKNPLTWHTKIHFLERTFPDVTIDERIHIRNPYQALEQLGKDGYKDVIFVVGQDRFDTFQTMHQYTEGFGIEKLEIVSAGWRDPSADDITGVSGTKMREIASQGEFKLFESLVPDSMEFNDKILMFNILRTHLVVGVNT